MKAWIITKYGGPDVMEFGEIEKPKISPKLKMNIDIPTGDETILIIDDEKIVLDVTQDILENFRDSSFRFAKANITNATLTQVPRLFLEAVGFGIIIFIITYLV